LLAAARAARAKRIPVVAFLGCDGGPLSDLADIAIVIPSDDTSRSRSFHLALEHLIVEAVEEELAT
jgi:phosphoheptose isomerase